MKFTFWNLNIDYISNKMYFYLHLRCTTLMFSFLYSCVGVLPWPPHISCFLKWCSVSYVPVSSLTLAVTFLLISTMMLSFLGPCLTLAATTLFISIMMFGFSCPCVKSYLGFHPSRDDFYTLSGPYVVIKAPHFSSLYLHRQWICCPQNFVGHFFVLKQH